MFCVMFKSVGLSLLATLVPKYHANAALEFRCHFHKWFYPKMKKNTQLEYHCNMFPLHKKWEELCFGV